MTRQIACTFGCVADETSTWIDTNGKAFEVCPKCHWVAKRRGYKRVSEGLKVVEAPRPENDHMPGVDDVTLDNDFTPCDTCAGKPGSAALCLGCLRNRTLISKLQQALRDREASQS